MKSRKKNILITALISIMVISGLAWNLSQSGSLLGRFSVTPIIPSDYGQSILDAMSVDELVAAAETQMDNAYGYETNAMAAATDAVTAYNDFDETALEAAQTDADQNASYADASATAAQNYADELLSRYEFEARVELLDLVTSTPSLEELVQDASDRYESALAEYETIFEPYWEHWLDLPDLNPTDDIPTEELITEEWMTQVITETEFWNEYTDARQDYLEAYTELTGLLEIVDLTEANASYLEVVQDYEIQRQEFETSVFEYSIDQNVLNGNTMQNLGAGFDMQTEVLDTSSFTSLQTQMGTYLNSQSLFTTAELEITNFQLNNSMFNNYRNFQNNVSEAIQLASGETAAEIYAAYEIAETYAINARVYASLAEGYAIAANLYQLLACSSLMISPTTYVMDSTEVTADFPIIAAVSLTPTISGTYAQWAGTLSFSATGSGKFDQGSASTDPLTIAMTSAGTQVVNFSGGVSGDTITVQVVGEPICMQTITISQAAASLPTEVVEDSDGDGLTDTEEADLGTDPLKTDTDGDGLSDYDEVYTYGTMPLDTDTDGDGLSDYDEVITYGTDPLKTDTDGDGLSDYDEVMVYDSDPLDATSGITETCNSLTLSPSTLELDEDESSTIAIEVDIDGTWDGDVYIVWSDNDAFITSEDGEVHTSEFAGEGPLTTGTYYLLYTSGGNTGTEDETETLSISLEGSDCSDTISITIPAVNTLNATEDCEEDYEDVEEDDWFAETVCRLTDAGYVEGREQYSYYSIFDPSDEITKAETLKLISLILLDLDEDDAEGGSSDFTDPNLTTEWFYWAVINTEAEDVLRTRDAGTIGNFNTDITRGELAVYIARALGLTAYSFTSEYDDVDEEDWFAYAIALLSRTDEEYTKDMPYDGSDEELPVLEGYSDGTFRPYDDINRAEALTMIYRAYQIYIAD